MAAPFDLNDDSVVVIVGSGAGGGTLGNELAQKGIDVVMPRGRRRHETRGFHQRRMGELRPARLDGQAHDLRRLAGARRTSPTCRPGSSSRSAARRPTGPAPRCASRSTSSRRCRPTASSRAPTCSTGRSRSPSWSPITPRPRTRWASPAPTAGRACPATTTSRCSKAGADKLGYKECHTGNMAINSATATAAIACQQTGFCFQGCKWGAKWSTLYTEIPQGRGDRQLRGPARTPWRCKIEHDAAAR